MISNEDVLNWFRMPNSKEQDVVYAEFTKYFINFSLCCSSHSLFTKIKRLNEKVTSIKRKRNDKLLKGTLSAQFQPPVPETPHERSLASANTQKERDLIDEVKKLKTDNKSLKRKLEGFDQLETKYKLKTEEINILSDNLNNAVLSTMHNSEVNKFSKQIKNLNKQLDESMRNIKELGTEKHNLQKKTSNLKRQLTNINLKM